MAETLSIEPRRKGRGRSWTVECLGIITADRYWSAPSGDACRPVYLCVAQKGEVVRGFAAHLQAGRPATLRSQHGHDEPHQVEWHAGLRWAEPQRVAGGITVATAWLPELCELDAPRMPDRLRFLLAPGERWVEEQLASPQVQELPAELRRAAVEGGLFAAFVSTRTAWPIVPDPLFHAVLWRGVQHQPWIVTPSGTALRPGPLWVYPSRPAGLAGVALFDAGHHEFQEVLRGETRRYFEREGAGRVEGLGQTTEGRTPPIRPAPPGGSPGDGPPRSPSTTRRTSEEPIIQQVRTNVSRETLPEPVYAAPVVTEEPRGRRVRVEGDLYHGRVPAGAVYIGRAAPGLPESPWRNPFRVKDHGADALEMFRRYLDANPDLVERARRELAGRDLACWCREGAPCHGDEWLSRIAEQEEPLGPSRVEPAQPSAGWQPSLFD